MTPLHYIGDFLREAFLRIPMWGARALFLGLIGVILIWVLRLPTEATTPLGGARRWDENLKWTAAAALLLQFVLYAVL